jgi:hypothetical protein
MLMIHTYRLVLVVCIPASKRRGVLFTVGLPSLKELGVLYKESYKGGASSLPHAECYLPICKRIAFLVAKLFYSS